MLAFPFRCRCVNEKNQRGTVNAIVGGEGKASRPFAVHRTVLSVPFLIRLKACLLLLSIFGVEMKKVNFHMWMLVRKPTVCCTR